jgi:hypothetical protein
MIASWAIWWPWLVAMFAMPTMMVRKAEVVRMGMMMMSNEKL